MLAVTIRRVLALIRACIVTEAARELGPKLRMLAMPDDLDPDGDDWELVTHLRHRLTNCEALVGELPDCPQDCPVADLNDDDVGGSCSNRLVAQDMLETRARWVALGGIDAWRRARVRAVT